MFTVEVVSPETVSYTGEADMVVARTVDVYPQHLKEVLGRAAPHKGTPFVEIYQNCPVYNDAIFDYIKDKKTAADSRLVLEHGKPLTSAVLN